MEVERTGKKQTETKKNSPVALPRLLNAHVHYLTLHVLLDLGLRVVAPALGEPVPEHRRLGLEHDDEVEPALREEVAAVEVDDVSPRRERFFECVDDLFPRFFLWVGVGCEFGVAEGG